MIESYCVDDNKIVEREVDGKRKGTKRIINGGENEEDGRARKRQLQDLE